MPVNNIPIKQNEQRYLDLLAAQRQLYSNAKNLQGISVFIGVPAVVAWSVLVAISPKLTVYAGLWGIAATFLEILFFSRLQKKTQKRAAKVQQLFDCEVLQFNWSNLNCGVRIEPEVIIEASNKFKKKNKKISALKDWYPPIVGELPIYQARIVCQRANVWWDSRLRRRYARWIVAILSVLTVSVFLIGLIGGLTLEKLLLAILLPLTPAFSLGLRQYNEHNEAADSLDRLRENSEVLISKTVKGKLTQQDLETESYSLQTQIYDNRRRSPLIFDWIYSRLKKEQEEQMNKGAESFARELIRIP